MPGNLLAKPDVEPQRDVACEPLHRRAGALQHMRHPVGLGDRGRVPLRRRPRDGRIGRAR